MPRLLPLVLRRLGGGAVTLAVIALLVLLPARQVLRPAWPDRVEEILTEAGPGRIERRFLPAGSADIGNSLVVASSRPITLWRVETDSGEVIHAWLAGVRDGQGQLLPALPPWLEGVRLDGPLPEAVRLVLTTAARERREIDGAGIRRMIRPNAMAFSQRAALWRDRLAERWQWPFRATADARMKPPPR